MKNTLRTRYQTIRQYDNVTIGRFEACFLVVKSYICELLNRERKINWNNDRVNWNIETITYHYSHYSFGAEGGHDWVETSVDQGYFKNWHITEYPNGSH